MMRLYPYRPSMERGVREGASPFNGLPEVVAAEDTGQAEVSSLGRATDATMDAIAGAVAGPGFGSGEG